MGALEQRTRLEVEKPVRVHFPETAGPIVSVTVGGRHTFALDSTGRSYSFGDDRRIQLGLGDTRTGGKDERHSYGVLHQDHLGGMQVKAEIKRAVTYRFYDPHMQASPVETMAPHVYNRPPYPPPSFIACGEDFTVAIHRDSPDWYSEAESTNVLVCTGENGEGQCGRSLQQQQQTWTPVRLPKRSRTVGLSCGQAHCLALLASGDLFAWGANYQGQVGNGKRSIVPKPHRVSQQPPAPVAPVPAPQPEPQARPRSAKAPQQEPESSPPPPPPPPPLPGQVVGVFCGFRNSAVICKVPQGSS